MRKRSAITMFRTWISFTFSFSDLPSILKHVTNAHTTNRSTKCLTQPNYSATVFFILIGLSQHHNSAFLRFRHNLKFPRLLTDLTSKAISLPSRIVYKSHFLQPKPPPRLSGGFCTKFRNDRPPPCWGPPPFRIHNSAQFWWFPQLFPFLSGVRCMQNWIPSV